MNQVPASCGRQTWKFHEPGPCFCQLPACVYCWPDLPQSSSLRSAFCLPGCLCGPGGRHDWRSPRSLLCPCPQTSVSIWGILLYSYIVTCTYVCSCLFKHYHFYVGCSDRHKSMNICFNIGTLLFGTNMYLCKCLFIYNLSF